MTNLLPCAHCKSEARFDACDMDGENFGGEFIECTNRQCGISTPLMFPTMEEVKTKLAEIWNKRK